jgi:hypothetical protein
MADVLREAISVLWFITRELASGNKILVQRGGETSELVLPTLEGVRAAEQVREQGAGPDRRGDPATA